MLPWVFPALKPPCKSPNPHPHPHPQPFYLVQPQKPHPHPPCRAQAALIHSLERETHGHVGAGKERPSCKLIGDACGSWKWGFLCFCFTTWSFRPQSSPDLIRPPPRPLPPDTHTYAHTCTEYMRTDRPAHCPIPLVRSHSQSNAAMASGEQMAVWRKCCLSTMFVLFTTN